MSPILFFRAVLKFSMERFSVIEGEFPRLSLEYVANDSISTRVCPGPVFHFFARNGNFMHFIRITQVTIILMVIDLAVTIMPWCACMRKRGIRYSVLCVCVCVCFLRFFNLWTCKIMLRSRITVITAPEKINSTSKGRIF